MSQVSCEIIFFFFFYQKRIKWSCGKATKGKVSLTGARPPSVDRDGVAVKTGAQIGFLKGLDHSRLLRDHKALNSQSRWKALRRVGTGQEERPRGIFQSVRCENHRRTELDHYVQRRLCQVGQSGRIIPGSEHQGEINHHPREGGAGAPPPSLPASIF